MSEIKKFLQNARQCLTDNMKVVEKSGDVCLKQIHNLRQDINAIFDRLQRRTILEIEKGKSSEEGKIQTKIDRIDYVTDRLQKLSVDLNDGGEKNEATSYICFAKCNAVIRKANVLLQDINKKDEYRLSFHIYKGIAEYLSSLEMLGEVICEREAQPHLGPDYAFEVRKHAMHNVKVKDDKDMCGISGICKLATGEFLLADNHNSKLKLLNRNYEVISTCYVPEYPHDVCLTGEREAAVTVNDKGRHEIHFFRVCSESLLKTKSVKLPNPCIGLAHSLGYLYITANTDLHVFNISSGQGKKLYTDKTGSYTVFRCAISPDGSRIYITNNDHSQLVILNKDGTKLFTLTHPELKNPLYVHASLPDHVFVSCHHSNTVVHVLVKIDETQKVDLRLTPLVMMKGEEKGLTDPTALCFNSSKNTLVVGLFKNDNIVELQQRAIRLVFLKKYTLKSKYL